MTCAGHGATHRMLRTRKDALYNERRCRFSLTIKQLISSRNKKESSLPGTLRDGRPALRLSPEFLGKLIFARFLELPLTRFERRVVYWERLPLFEQLCRKTDAGQPVTVKSLVGSHILRDVAVPCSRVLGCIVHEGNGPTFLYRSEAFVSQYEVNPVALEAFLAREQSQASNVKKLIGRLRLVNTRNRLTDALVRLLMEQQADYIGTGELVRLRPLSQTEVARRLQGRFEMPGADRSRISRLIRGLSIELPWGQKLSLQSLCPRARDVHRHLVSHVVRREQALLVQGSLDAPLTDSEVAQWLSAHFGQQISRRTVAYIRRQLGVPSKRERMAGSGYLAATSGFTPLLPFTIETVQVNVGAEPGVYEVRRVGLPPGEGNEADAVIYVGSTTNLRKRLLDHLRGDNSNELLQEQLKEGELSFHYRVIHESWRDMERFVYDAYCQTFGKPPVCNRMRP